VFDEAWAKLVRLWRRLRDTGGLTLGGFSFLYSLSLSLCFLWWMGLMGFGAHRAFPGNIIQSLKHVGTENLLVLIGDV
jgi:hypothetical protein